MLGHWMVYEPELKRIREAVTSAHQHGRLEVHMKAPADAGHNLDLMMSKDRKEIERIIHNISPDIEIIWH